MRKYIVSLAALVVCAMLLACGEVAEETTSITGAVTEKTEISASNEINLPDMSGAEGDKLSMPLSIGGNVDFCAVDMKVYYDKDKLRFIEFTDSDDDVVANCNAEEGTVSVNFLRIKNVTKELLLCNLNFEVITDESCESTIRIEPIEIVKLDEDEKIVYCDCTVQNGKVMLNGGGANEQ